ncbi:hypothetical protein K474DRAFT_1603060 [Panus rudis PR-1116 ss-1]|nr:hypothetical protein K474DRAFT_1603060 [Panus rudis PR-1116 ss-1]
MAHNAHYSNPDPEIGPILSQMPPSPPMHDLKIAREEFKTIHLPHLQNLFKPDLPEDSAYSVRDHTVPVEGGDITIRVIIPQTNPHRKEYPVLLWYHSGGFMLGGIDQDDYYLRRLSVDFQVVIVNVDYRKHPFPIGLNDSYSAIKWVVENAASISVSPKLGFILAGCSAGANFSAVLSIRARDDPYFKDRGVAITGQWLQAPTILHPDANVQQFKDDLYSMEQNKDAPILSAQMLRDQIAAYGAPPEDPEYSVALAPSHKDLPPAYVQVCGLDPLRDDGLLYEKILRDNGVHTKLDIYPGLPHGGFLYFLTFPIAKRFLADAREGLRWLLQTSGGVDV